MTLEKKQELLADILEVEPAELTEDVLLEDLDTWDSIAGISIAAMMDEEFHKDILANDIKKFKTVGDIFAIMEE